MTNQILFICGGLQNIKVFVYLTMYHVLLDNFIRTIVFLSMTR